MDSFSRYARQIELSGFGKVGQEALAKATVVLIGVGGVGAGALPLLVSSGIGRIIVVDSDIVSESNLHRQTIYSNEDIGKKKALAASDFAKKHNPNLKVEAITQRIDSLNLAEKIIADCDFCIDATDSFATRILVSDACKRLAVHLIMASAEGYVAQNIFCGGNFYLDSVLSLTETESAKSLPIFPAAAHLSGVWAAGEAIAVLAKLRNLNAGRIKKFDFKKGSNPYFEVEL